MHNIRAVSLLRHKMGGLRVEARSIVPVLRLKE